MNALIMNTLNPLLIIHKLLLGTSMQEYWI